MKKIILLILCLLPLAMFAQSAMDYFHTSANYYVNADKKNAKTSVQEGIRKYPDNQKLKTLASKIDQLPDPEENQNQQNQQQNQDQDQQDKNDKGNPKDQKGDQKEEQQRKQEQQRQQNQDKRQLDALQQNERKTKEKVDQKEMRQGKNIPQEKDW